MKVIRIIRTPALESAIARFDGWWSGRTRNERVLLSILGVLLGAIILVYGVILPLQNARAKAFADIRTYETLNARIRAAGSLGPQIAQRTGPPLQVVQSSASGFGITPQAEALPDGSVRATIADASYDSIVSWIADLGASSQLKVRRVTLTRGGAPGRVSAVVEFGV
jgi:general secretion pathway protein M